MKGGLPGWLRFPSLLLVTQGTLQTMGEVIVKESWQGVISHPLCGCTPPWMSGWSVEMCLWSWEIMGWAPKLARVRHLGLLVFWSFKFLISIVKRTGVHNGKTIILPDKILGVNPPILVWGNTEQAARDLCGLLAAPVLRESQGSYLFTRLLKHWVTNKRSWYLRGGLMESWLQEQGWQSEVGSWAWKCTGKWGHKREKLRNCPNIMFKCTAALGLSHMFPSLCP